MNNKKHSSCYIAIITSLLTRVNNIKVGIRKIQLYHMFRDTGRYCAFMQYKLTASGGGSDHLHALQPGIDI